MIFGNYYFRIIGKFELVICLNIGCLIINIIDSVLNMLINSFLKYDDF